MNYHGVNSKFSGASAGDLVYLIDQIAWALARFDHPKCSVLPLQSLCAQVRCPEISGALVIVAFGSV